MKKALKSAALLLAIALGLTGCNHSEIDGFKKSKTGLHYKFIEEHKDAQQVQPGDCLVLNITMKLDTLELYSGGPSRFFVKDPMFEGDFPEGLLMMHEGDSAVFAIAADSVARFFEEDQMPPTFKAGQKMHIYYEVRLLSIISKSEYEQEEANYQSSVNALRESEPERLNEYINNNAQGAKADSTGLFILVNKKGKGPKIASGNTLTLNFTGRTLDGTIFGTNIEERAKEGGLYNANIKYEPLTYVIGNQKMYPDWESGLMGQTKGSEVTLIFPSKLAFAEQGAGELIGPYEPLVFEIEILDVK